MRNNNKKYNVHEANFAAQVAKCHTQGTYLAIPNAFFSMVLFSGSNIDDSQIIPILSSAVNGSYVSTDDLFVSIFTQINSEKVASILPQCDFKYGQESSRKWTYTENAAHISNQSIHSVGLCRSRNNHNQGSNRQGRNKMAPDELHVFKLESKCNKCVYHWH